MKFPGDTITTETHVTNDIWTDGNYYYRVKDGRILASSNDQASLTRIVQRHDQMIAELKSDYRIRQKREKE